MDMAYKLWKLIFDSEDPPVSSTERSCLGAVAFKANEDGTSDATRRWVSKRTSFTERCVFNTMKALEEKGLCTSRPPYVLNLEAVLSVFKSGNDVPSGNQIPTKWEPDSYKVGTTFPPINKQENNVPPLPPSGGECAHAREGGRSSSSLPLTTPAPKGDGEPQPVSVQPTLTDSQSGETAPEASQRVGGNNPYSFAYEATERAVGAPDPITARFESDGADSLPLGVQSTSSDGGKTKKSKHAYSPEFEAWWSRYPKTRRVDKSKCFAKWERLLRDGDVDVQTLNAGLDAWLGSADWAKDGGRYVCAPLVWFNQQRWEAEPQKEADAKTDDSGVREDDDPNFVLLLDMYERLAKKRPNIANARNAYAAWKAKYGKQYTPKVLRAALDWAWRSPRWDKDNGRYIPQLDSWLSNDDMNAEYGAGWLGDLCEYKDSTYVYREAE